MATRLSRVSDELTIDARFLFPSEDLLDHVPLLIDGIAGARMKDEPITVATPVDIHTVRSPRGGRDAGMIEAEPR